MATARGLEQILSRVAHFEHPSVELEQYPTPAHVAARLIHLADLRGDIQDRTVVDLGSGPGILAIGCAYRQPRRIVGVEIDARAMQIARANERRVDAPVPIDWLLADALAPPLCPTERTTVVMNPPFGAQRENVHADRGFLEAASRFATVSYSLHNEGSRAFIDAFVADRNGRVTDAVAVKMELDRQFPFHDEAQTEIDAELYRIVWTDE